MENLSENQIEKIETILGKIREFSLFTNSKEKEFLIEFYANTQFINIIAVDKKTNYIFKSLFSLTDLYQIDRYFKFFNSPEDIANDIYELYQNNNISIECERLSNIYLIINWEFNSKKQMSKIKLIGKETNKELHLIQISNKLDSLEKKNIQSNQEIDELKKLINQLQEELKKKDNKFNNFVNLFQIKSNIILYFTEYEFILNQIQEFTKYKVNNLILLYKATRDGDNYDTFKSSVYQKANIVVFIRTDKGYRFGGYTSVGFEENNNYNDKFKTDDKAFLFSLYKEKSYPCNNPNNALRLNRDKLFIFGNGDIIVNKSFLNSFYGGGTSTQQSYNYKGEQAALTGVNGKAFQIKELEAYQCNFFNNK